MQAKAVFDLIHDEYLERLSDIYEVDKTNTKLIGSLMLKSMVRGVLLNRGLSLRSLQMMVENMPDLKKMLASKNESKKNLHYSTIAKRLKNINIEYFKNIYEDLVLKYNKMFENKGEVRLNIFDSTIINLAGHAVKDGIKIGGKTNDWQVKVSIGFRNSLPSSIRFCTKQEESSEDIALARAINEAKVEKEDIVVFDRGISKADTYHQLTHNDIKFVTRIKTSRKFDIIKENEIDDQSIDKDYLIYLKSGSDSIKKTQLRLIIMKKDNEEFWFLTNIFECSSLDISEIYRKRWGIEVFFKFLKQNLPIKHFISHYQNGMTAYIYMVLIAAILFLIYKKLSLLTGFKLPLLKFILEIEQLIAVDIGVLRDKYAKRA